MFIYLGTLFKIDKTLHKTGSGPHVRGDMDPTPLDGPESRATRGATRVDTPAVSHSEKATSPTGARLPGRMV